MPRHGLLRSREADFAEWQIQRAVYDFSRPLRDSMA